LSCPTSRVDQGQSTSATPTHQTIFIGLNTKNILDNPGFKPKWLARLGLKTFLKPLKKADFKAAQSIDCLIANSTHIQDQISQFYKRDSIVVYPPIETSRIQETAKSTKTPRSGFVTVGRQVPYKKFDLIVQACTELDLPLTVIGNGPEHEALTSIAGPSVKFETSLNDDEVARALSSAEAFINVALEDFGVAPIEAMAAGTPVIAYKAGGALDYIEPGLSGTFFEDQTVDSLKTALATFNSPSFSSEAITKHSEQFSSDKFKENIRSVISSVLK
jgi:glycosyltransferase involved in cell wall biosynthesis